MRLPTRLPSLRRVLLLLFFVLVAAPADAQRRDNAPRRPRLPVDADSNAAAAYFKLGQDLLEREPRRAADAFYWASQLEPGWADPLYGQYAGLMLSDPRRLVLYQTGDRRTRSNPAVLRIDSLYYRALRLDPFLQPRFEREIIRRYLLSALTPEGSSGTEISLAEFYTGTIMRDLPPLLRGRVLAGEGRLANALREYDAALGERRTRNSEPLRVIRHERGRLYALAGNDSMALAELGHAIAAGEDKEQGEALIWFYENKAVLEHSRGLVHERRGDLAAARESYARALVEDLSYHPAHLRLGAIALIEGDSVTALSEMRLAVETGGDEPATRYAYARLLASLRRFPEAETELVAVTEMAPYYADGWLLLGMVRDWQRADATSAFRAFLERARRDDPRRVQVETLVSAS